ncbi:GNAT family acetyltransferase [Paramesorhizobium deserti]|uniref:GNAT family acetyltransferase n=1 Tax=Paramesorhizobium deserti TaxID=1494590 RepID=A0A135HW63_9HYPH|nr:GNAT family N-acetyltransferase [Paramesorhizobium deserti]KXF77437.1 GNAT family acetyltransferase [Paramesorhizobium deserti]
MISEDDPANRNIRPHAGAVNLSLRAARAEDCEALTALINLPRFRAGTLRLPYHSVEWTRKWLENQGVDGLSIVAELDGCLVGYASLNRYPGRRSHAAWVAIGVHDDYQGRGIGTALLGALTDAADNWLALKRLELNVYVDNEPAIRLYEKFGFEQEGVSRAFAFKAGRYVDALNMARLRL